MAAGAAILLMFPGTAHAMREDRDALAAYARARAADSFGAVGAAAQNYAAALAFAPDNQILAARALSQAMAAGDRVLALQAARILAKSGLVAPDTRFLLMTEAIRTKDWAAASAELDAIEADKIFAMLAPVVRAWIAFESKAGDPLVILAAAQADPAIASYAAEHRPLMLLALGQHAEGIAELQALTETGGGRASRLRIAGAATLVKQGKRAEALKLLAGNGAALAAARTTVEAGRQLPASVDSAASGTAEFMVRVAADLAAQEANQVALTYARLATFLAADNSIAWLVTSELLAAADHDAEALAVLGKIPGGDPFVETVEDRRIRLLMETGDEAAAFAAADARARAAGSTVADWTRLGDLQSEAEQPALAAEAYAEALRRLRDGGDGQPEWVLLLLQGGALEQAGRWPEARDALEAAHKLAPDQPVVLNYLGYAQLERRENLPEAERLIREAARLRPHDPAITDSLGWAQYLQGNVAEAVTLLEQAAAGEPGDVTINEHLGDAYYSAGRRIEARFAWRAALVFADNEDAERLRAKIEIGLTEQLAAR